MRRPQLERAASVVALGLPLSVTACAAQRDQELGLTRELARARADAALQAAHAAELSSRVAQLEQRLAWDAALRVSTEREVLRRLEQLLARAERPAAAPAPSLAETAVATPLPPPPVTSAATAKPTLDGATPEEQLRSLVERWRGHAINRPLTREQNQALRVLLKPERQLDSKNPWPGPWY